MKYSFYIENFNYKINEKGFVSFIDAMDVQGVIKYSFNGKDKTNNMIYEGKKVLICLNELFLYFRNLKSGKNSSELNSIFHTIIYTKKYGELYISSKTNFNFDQENAVDTMRKTDVDNLYNQAFKDIKKYGMIELNESG